MTDTRPPVSAIIRTVNEERMIADVVRAALLAAREVVVVDSGSTDQTVALARAAGARVIEHEWMGWGRQKRIAEDACLYDWMLDLDADEVVTQEFADELEALFADGAPPKKIYRTMLALVPPIGKPWKNFGNQTRHKVYDRRIVRAPDHDGWDQFRLPKDIEIGHMRARLLHFAFTDAGHLMEKLNRNSSIPAPLKSKPYLAMRIVFGLPFYFAKRYFSDQYFRGGVYGVALALMYGVGRWLRDVKMWEEVNKA